MEKKLAFVLGGGGSHGALQVGALRALYEEGIQPDFLVGTSIGSLNSAFLAVHGMDEAGLKKLEETWLETVNQEILPPNYVWLSLRSVFGRPDGTSAQRLEQFFISHGIGKDLKFGDLKGIPFVAVSTDLNSALPVLFGTHPEDGVLSGVLASAALPPWIRAIEENGKYLVDGGFVSNLPVEPALTLGATAIIALDLADPMGVWHDLAESRWFFNKAIVSVQERNRELELALAEARKVPVLDILLMGDELSIPLWDFTKSEMLIERGYEIAKASLDRARAKGAFWSGYLQRHPTSDLPTSLFTP